MDFHFEEVEKNANEFIGEYDALYSNKRVILTQMLADARLEHDKYRSRTCPKCRLYSDKENAYFVKTCKCNDDDISAFLLSQEKISDLVKRLMVYDDKRTAFVKAIYDIMRKRETDEYLATRAKREEG